MAAWTDTSLIFQFFPPVDFKRLSVSPHFHQRLHRRGVKIQAHFIKYILFFMVIFTWDQIKRVAHIWNLLFIFWKSLFFRFAATSILFSLNLHTYYIVSVSILPNHTRLNFINPLNWVEPFRCGIKKCRLIVFRHCRFTFARTLYLYMFEIILTFISNNSFHLIFCNKDWEIRFLLRSRYWTFVLTNFPEHAGFRTHLTVLPIHEWLLQTNLAAFIIDEIIYCFWNFLHYDFLIILKIRLLSRQINFLSVNNLFSVLILYW